VGHFGFASWFGLVSLAVVWFGLVLSLRDLLPPLLVRRSAFIYCQSSKHFANYLLYAIGMRDGHYDADDGAERENEKNITKNERRDTTQFRVRMLTEFLPELAFLDVSRFAHFANSLLATAAVYLDMHSVLLRVCGWACKC
jgi:hypothetical protein